MFLSSCHLHGCLTSHSNGERDSEDVVAQTQLVRGLTELCGAARYASTVPPQQRRALVSAMDRYCARCGERLVSGLAAAADMAAGTPQLMERLLALRGALPAGVNVSRLVVGHPGLMRHEGAQLPLMVAQVRGVRAGAEGAGLWQRGHCCARGVASMAWRA